jgi:hypothetical protein
MTQLGNTLSAETRVQACWSYTRTPTMYSAMVRLLDALTELEADSRVIGWASPVPFFGDLGGSRVATVGINPSNLEFVDGAGLELDLSSRRLATLSSLRLNNWESTDGDHVRTILGECESYFGRNPYRRWFDVLERMLKTSGHSYYPSSAARLCHLDLVPFATFVKWGSLPPLYRRALIDRGRHAMAELIRDSSLELLILNGRSVVTEFEAFAKIKLTAETRTSWSLPRRDGNSVSGVLFRGEVVKLGKVELERPVRIIGYNHNLQSSFGVTSSAMRSIGDFLGDQIAIAPTY